MKLKNKNWERGQQAAIARKAGVRPSDLNDILHRRRQAGPLKARLLEIATKGILEEMIPWEAFLESRATDNKFFYGEPEEASMH